MTAPDPQVPPSNPPPPGRPPFAPPAGTPYYGSPHDASWVPPPGSVFGGGPDVLATSGRKSRDRSAWPTVALPVPVNPGADPADRADREQGGRAVPLLLAMAAIVAALVTARAALLGSDATSDWQRSVGDEQRRGAMLLEEVRYTYGSEGDMAMMIITADVQAQELRAVAAGQPPEVVAIVESEAQVQQQLVDLVGPSSELYTDPRYRIDSGGVDLQLRLADSRAEDAGDDPLVALAQGDGAADTASRLMLTTLFIAGAFLLGAIAQALRRRPRILLAIGWVALESGSKAAIAVQLGLVGAVG